MSTRICPRCLNSGTLEDFGTSASTRHGFQVYCKTCSRAIDRERRQRRIQWMQDIKISCGCADCGYNEHPAALQWDHLPEFVKEFNIATAITKSKKRLIAEMSKCEVVCANCHAIRTANRREVVLVG